MFSGYGLNLFLQIFLRKEFTPIEWHFAYSSVADPDLQISWGGGGGGDLKKKFFQPFGPQFGLKIRRVGRAPWAPPPGSATDLATV